MLDTHFSQDKFKNEVLVEMDKKLLISGLIVLLIIIASVQGSSNLFHRHYWHGISEVGNMGPPDATTSDGGLIAIWGDYYNYPDSIYAWLVKIDDDGFIKNDKVIKINQSTLKGNIVKIAKTNWGYVIIAGDHLVGLDSNFNVVWCKEPRNNFEGGQVIVSDGDKVIIGEEDTWGLPYSYV